MLTLNAIIEQSTWEIIGGAGKGVPWVRQEFESEWGCAHETCASLAEFTFARKIPGGGTRYNGLYGEATPERSPFSGWTYIKGLGFHEVKCRKV